MCTSRASAWLILHASVDASPCMPTVIGKVCSASQSWSNAQSLYIQSVHSTCLSHASATSSEVALKLVSRVYEGHTDVTRALNFTTSTTTFPLPQHLPTLIHKHKLHVPPHSFNQSTNQPTNHHAAPNKHHPPNPPSLHVPREHGLFRGLRRVVHAQGAGARAGGGHRCACAARGCGGSGEKEVKRVMCFGQPE